MKDEVGLSPFGKLQVEKRRKALAPDLELRAYLRTHKANDNWLNPVRQELIALDQQLKKEFSKHLLDKIWDKTTERWFKPNIWNLGPQALSNLHFYLKFELMWRTNMKKASQLRTKRGLLIIKGNVNETTNKNW